MKQQRQLCFCILGVLLVIALILAPFADASPDGFERTCEDKSIPTNVAVWRFSPAFEYKIPGIKNQNLSIVFSAAGGSILVCLLVWGLCRVVIRPRTARV